MREKFAFVRPDDPAPQISVVVPCFNAHAHLGQTLSSLREQSFRDFEVIVVDDGSTDPGTLAFLGTLAPDIRLIRQENRGLPGARNRGFTEARAPLVLPLDSDDWIAPEFLQLAYEKIGSAPPNSFVFADLVLEGESCGVLRKPFNLFEQLYFNQLPYCLLIPKAAWKAVGGYDASMRQGYEDWEFNLRLGLNGYIGVPLEAPLFHYRVSSTGMLAGLSRRRHMHLWESIRTKHAHAYRAGALLRTWEAWRGAASTHPLALYLVWELLYRLIPTVLLTPIFRVAWPLSHSAREARRLHGLRAMVRNGWRSRLWHQAAVPVVMLPAVFSRVAAYLILLVTARLLLPDDFGVFAVFTVIGGIINAVVSGGGDMWLNRFSTHRHVVDGRPPQIWPLYLAISGAVALASLAIGALAVWLVPPLDAYREAILLGTAAFCVAGMAEAVLALMRSSGRTALFFMTRDLLVPAALLVIALTVRPTSAEVLFLIYLLVWLGVLAGVGVVVVREAAWPPNAHLLRRRLLLPALAHTGFLIATNLSSRVANYFDVLVLMFFIGLGDLGEYRVAAQFAIGFLVIQHFVFLNLPYQLRQSGDETSRLQTRQRLRDYQASLVVLALVALAVAIGAVEWLLSLFGKRFMDSAAIAQALFLIRFLELLWGPQHEILVSNGLVRYDASANAIGICVWCLVFAIVATQTTPFGAAIVASGFAVHTAHAFRAYALNERGIYCPRLVPLPAVLRRRLTG